MKFPSKLRPAPLPKRPTPLVVPLVELLPNQGPSMQPDWAVAPPAPQVEPEIDEIAEAEARVAAAAQAVEQARREAEAAGLRAAQDKVEAIVTRYLDAVARLDQAARDMHPSPVEIVELALVVAREILHREATVDQNVIVTAVEQALAQTRDLDEVTVRVGPTDYQYIRQRRPDLVEAGVTFREDPTLAIGGCVVETPLEVRDGSLEARIEATRGALIALLREGGAPADKSDAQGAPGTKEAT